ncbi:MAG: class I SAM-dependent methyltransferase [Thermoleophilia bacterium]
MMPSSNFKNQDRAVEDFFNKEVRKHPSFLLNDRKPTNFLLPSEDYARRLLGDWDRSWNILDIGCGDAVDSISLAATTNKVWAIDVAESRIELARDNVERAGLSDRVFPSVMDVHVLDFPDEHFDLVIGNSVLLFLDRGKFAKECFRVLKPGGRALFPNESMKKHPLLLARRLLPGIRDRESIADRLTLKEIDLFSRYFAEVEHRQFYLFSVALAPFAGRFGKASVFCAALRSTYRIDEITIRRFKRLRDYCWISVINLRKAGTQDK